MFGTTIQRMIFAELLRVFFIALFTLTGLFLIAGVLAEASQRGLSPTQVVMVIPLLVPNTLPYTVPATCLFATCVVYGRLAHDNEITAIKASGVHLGRLMGPAVLLGLLMSAGTLALYYQFIPATHHMLRTQILGDVEELLYGLLKKQGCLKHPKMPYAMWVRQVQGRRLIDALIKKREMKNGGYECVAWAREARIHFDPVTSKVRVDMSYVSTYGENDMFSGNMIDPSQEIDLPTGIFGGDYIRRPSDLSWTELIDQRSQCAEALDKARDNFNHPERLDAWPASERARGLETFQNELIIREREFNGILSELHFRPAVAVGCLCFVLIGAPVGIWFSRADYLSSFVSCFLPTVFVYYPLLLAGSNMAKDGRISPALGMWVANGIVGVLAFLILSRLTRR